MRALAAGAELEAPQWLARHLRRHTTISLTIRIDDQVAVLERLTRRQVADLAATIMRALRRNRARHHPRPLPVDGAAYRHRQRRR